MSHIKVVFEKGMVKSSNLDYLVYLPESYDDKSEWPLILFLHGATELGNDVEILKREGLPKILETIDNFPFVVVSPQCPRGSNWRMKTKELYELLQSVKKTYNINDRKVYLTGLSMGGFGTWFMALVYPDEFAAIAPICGGLRSSDDVSVLKNLPIWNFHGARDKVIPIEMSQRLVDALNSCGGNIKFTVYPDLEHDSWTITYNNKELYDWFLEHEK